MKPFATSPAYYTPSGQLSHAGQRKWFAPAEIKRMLDNLAANSRLPGLGTAYGRMMLEEAISIPEFEACRRWDDLRASYLAALDASGLRSQLSALDARGGEAPDPGSELGEKIATRDRRIIAEYMAALRVIEAVGRVEHIDFRGVCESDNYATYSEKGNVRRCARALVAFWNISDIEKPKKRRS